MLPSCDQLPASVWLEQDAPRAEFEARLTTLGTDAGGWVVVARCDECGQVWRVDQPDRLQVSLAIKAPTPELAEWTPAEDRAARLEYLVRSYGGEGAEGCMWAGCPHRALRGVAFCAEHLYASGARARGG